MACIEVQEQVKTHSHTGKQGFGYSYSWLSKKNPLRTIEAGPNVKLPLCKTRQGFSQLTSRLRVLATNLLPLTGPGLRPTIKNSS